MIAIAVIGTFNHGRSCVADGSGPAGILKHHYRLSLIWITVALQRVRQSLHSAYTQKQTIDGTARLLPFGV